MYVKYLRHCDSFRSNVYVVISVVYLQ